MQNCDFAGGCFWCLDPAFDNEPGVLQAIVNYAGGRLENPTYDQVLTEQQVIVNLSRSPMILRKFPMSLVEVFFHQIDPTDAGGQFADRGESYTTAYLVSWWCREKIAEDFIKKLNDSKNSINRLL